MKPRILSHLSPLFTPVILVFAACGGSPQSSEKEHEDKIASRTNRDTQHNLKSVFLIMMENKDWGDLVGNSSAPFLNSLLPAAAHAEDYHGAPGVHPSEPNYIWLVAGDNFDIDGFSGDDDPPHNPGGSGNHVATTQHLAAQLDAANISWRSYQENISGTVCPLQGEEPASGPQVGHGYRPKHNPFVFFDDLTGNFDPNDAGCIAHNRPLDELASDLQNNTAARFNLITPNLCNDMHDSCNPQNDSLKQGDDFLSATVPAIMSSQAFQDGGLIVIAWDECEQFLFFPCDDPIGMIAISPLAKPGYASTNRYDHSSMLRTFQDIFGVRPYLRAAASAPDLSELFTAYP